MTADPDVEIVTVDGDIVDVERGENTYLHIGGNVILALDSRNAMRLSEKLFYGLRDRLTEIVDG